MEPAKAAPPTDWSSHRCGYSGLGPRVVTWESLLSRCGQAGHHHSACATCVITSLFKPMASETTYAAGIITQQAQLQPPLEARRIHAVPPLRMYVLCDSIDCHAKERDRLRPDRTDARWVPVALVHFSPLARHFSVNELSVSAFHPIYVHKSSMSAAPGMRALNLTGRVKLAI